ncbi:protein NipSnap homolog 3A-like isoform X1 [Anguilla anguilla]|uniref:protein NipSnap homolog 3A-like isoform X1 n=1 Tax=Anguilla anguilla TaxID=7936 RepID=UPI0015AEA9F5|nr:protein NipSnap homolog 3A-like isoform X1 [Anguilla anguilla]
MLNFSNMLRRAFTLPKHVKYMPNLKQPLFFFCTQLRASVSTGPQQQHETFYEFRTYSIKPEWNAAFLELTEKKIHLRMALAELLGYWSVNCGALNQVLQIWKYDSYAQRSDARTALVNNPEWMEEYIAKAIPMLAYQENEVAYLVPWCTVKKPPKKGIYELSTFQMKPGGPAVWGHAFQAAINVNASAGYSHLVAVFHSEFGPLNQVQVLWWFEDPDTRAAIRHKAHGDARVVAAVRESVKYLDSQRSKLLLPTTFSPLQ